MVTKRFDFSTIQGYTVYLRKDNGPVFRATIGMLSDNDQYVNLILENGSNVMESVDKLICVDSCEVINEEK